MEKRLLSPARLRKFARKLQEDERSSATIENYLRHIRAFAVWAGGRPVTKELTAAWKEHLTGEAYCPGSVNTMLVSLNRFLGFLGWGGLRGQNPARPAAAVSRGQQRADTGGIRALGGRRPGQWAGTAGPSFGDHLLHRHPGLGGEVYHRGGAAAGQGRDLPERENSHHPVAGKAVPEAAQVRQETKNRLWRGVPHQKRERDFAKTNLGGDEIHLRQSQGGSHKGVPPQSAAPPTTWAWWPSTPLSGC